MNLSNLRITVVVYSCFMIISTFCTEQDNFYFLFSHGIADSHKQAFNYLPPFSYNKKTAIVGKPLITFDYPDVSSNIFKINRTQTSLAQDNEIQRLAQVFFSHIPMQKKCILFGVSRGASTIINFMSLYNPTNVAALVLESPFDCVESIVAQLAEYSKVSWIPGIKRNGTNLMRFIFCKYKPDGIRPIDQVASLAPDLPILIICSTQDYLVPSWSSINLYKILQETGHYNTHLLLLPEGEHAKLIKHERIGLLYQYVTHAFYQKYQLPHDPEYAQIGQDIFNVCQPSFDSLDLFYPSHRQELKIRKKQ